MNSIAEKANGGERMKLYKWKKEDTLTSIIAFVVIIISGTIGVVCAMYDITVFDLIIKLFTVFKTIIYMYIFGGILLLFLPFIIIGKFF